MMKAPLETALAGIGSYVDPSTFDKFRQRIDAAQVEKALGARKATAADAKKATATNAKEATAADAKEATAAAAKEATTRNRRLPLGAVLWLTVAMAVFRNSPIEELVVRLRLVRAGRRGATVAPSAIPQARKRLGEAPVRALFETVAAPAAHAHAQAPENRWRSLALYGIDGTTLRVPDSADNRATFGGHRGRKGAGESGYPLVRMVALMALASHLLAAVRFGPLALSELAYASALWAAIPDDSLTILDRAFLSAGLLLPLQHGGSNRHWMTRLKKNTRYRILESFGPGDWRVEFKVSATARTKDPSLPLTFGARVVRYQRKGFQPQLLVTSLLDPIAYPAHELAAIYHKRWELELGFAEIKTSMLERCETLRSKTSWGVRQEIWGLLLAYHLVRTEMADVARTAKVDPTRVSFLTMLRRVRDAWNWWAASGGQPLPPALQRLWDELVGLVLRARRPDRHYPRAVKIKMSKFKRKRPVVRQQPVGGKRSVLERKAA
jgi:hypothetical protein